MKDPALQRRYVELGEQDPRKQGLKPKAPDAARSSKTLGEQDPRKQGLKRWNLKAHWMGMKTRRARSKKTRIETTDGTNWYLIGVNLGEQDPRKQGLKLQRRRLHCPQDRSRRARSKKTRIETDCRQY